jgi:HlyD family secretion protein
VGFGSTITDNVVTYLTYLDVDNADLSLRPGMTATATITATQRTTCCWCPMPRCASPRSRAAAQPAKKGITSACCRGPAAQPRKRSAAAGASTAGARRSGCCATAWPVAVAVTPGISDGA